MAEGKLCPFKAGVAYTSLEKLCINYDTWNEAKQKLQEEFGQCDREKCALWVSRWNRYPENPAADKLWGKCGLIAAKPYVVANQHYHP